MKILIATLLALAVATVRAEVNPVKATFLVDENVQRPAAIAAAEANLGTLLTEINRAQGEHTILSTKSLPMNDFAIKSLIRLWAVTPFYCDDEEVVDRCWAFRDGSMMVSHIPLIITPEGEDFGVGSYQEAVVEFDKSGRITDFRLALDAQMSESLERCGSVVAKEQQMIILQQVERFRTAYNTKDTATIRDMFSDDALIITGKVTMEKSKSDIKPATAKVEYVKQTKEQYINKLKLAFARNKWIEVKFSEIGENGEAGGCAGITRSKVNGNMYGVRLRQEWRSANYNDEGYLFLLWEFPDSGKDPIIHVRTWQPEWAGDVKQQPDDDISTLGGFGL